MTGSVPGQLNEPGVVVQETIQISEPHASEEAARRDVDAVAAAGDREINPATAVTIASWWQSSGALGSTLAAFASGRQVSRKELLDDIAATRNSCGYGNGMEPADEQALDTLATFVIHA